MVASYLDLIAFLSSIELYILELTSDCLGHKAEFLMLVEKLLLHYCNLLVQHDINLAREVLQNESGYSLPGVRLGQ